jgi:hypothetical protein
MTFCASKASSIMERKGLYTTHSTPQQKRHGLNVSGLPNDPN